MAWNPALYTKSRKPIAKNLLAYIEEAMGDALTWAHGSPLPTFKKTYNSKVGRVSTKTPCLMVARAGTKVVKGDDGLHLSVTHVFGLEMKLTGSDPEEMNERSDDYLTALDSVCRNIPPERLLAGDGFQVHLVGIEVSDEDLDEAREGMVQMPSLIMTVSLLEVADNGS